MNRISEVEDIHPIFRASPFLIEHGAKLVKGEKYLVDESLKHIDLLLVDRQQQLLFVEIKWDSFNREQVDNYLRLLAEKARPFRLMWLVPDDLGVDIPPQVELKRYSRTEVESIVHVRRQAKDVLTGILRLLSEPITPPTGLMLGQSLLFPSIISACYFSAMVQTERGRRQLGLRKEATGRYLDLIRCIAQSHFASDLPELTTILVLELLLAPYYFEMRNRGEAVDSRGFHHFIFQKRRLQMYRHIAGIVDGVENLASEFMRKNERNIKGFYGEAPRKCDMLYRVLLDSPTDLYEMGDRMSVKGLIKYLIEAFTIAPTQPIKSFRHSILNIEIINNVNVTGYENDLAKRLIEIAVLKGTLIPVTGVSIIRVLRYEPFRGKYERVPSQSFRLCSDEQFIKSFGGRL